MKKKVALLMALLMVFAAGAVGAENWVKFLETPIGGEFFIDTDSITFIGNNRVSVWVKQVHTGYVMFQFFIDFSYKTSLIVSTLFYNRDGTLLYDGSFPFSSWHPIRYGDIDYYAYKFLESWLK